MLGDGIRTLAYFHRDSVTSIKRLKEIVMIEKDCVKRIIMIEKDWDY